MAILLPGPTLNQNSNTSMYQLVYSSVTHPHLSKETITELLSCSRSVNVTGCIAVHGNDVIHLIEGDKAAVNTLYKTIAAKSWNRHIILQYKQPIQQRSFDDNLLVSGLRQTALVGTDKPVLKHGDLPHIFQTLCYRTIAVKLFGYMVIDLFSQQDFFLF